MSLDALDKEILNIIQGNFPVAVEPYRVLAEQVGASEEEVLRRVQRLKDVGLIRRIGGIFDSRKLGYKSTLAALKVPAGRLEEVGAIINSYPGVTHNYVREHAYNMWFTLISPSKDSMERTIAEMEEKTGLAINILPALRFFKIKVNFKFKKNDEE